MVQRGHLCLAGEPDDYQQPPKTATARRCLLEIEPFALAAATFCYSDAMFPHDSFSFWSGQRNSASPQCVHENGEKHRQRGLMRVFEV